MNQPVNQDNLKKILGALDHIEEEIRKKGLLEALKHPCPELAQKLGTLIKIEKSLPNLHLIRRYFLNFNPDGSLKGGESQITLGKSLKEELDTHLSLLKGGDSREKILAIQFLCDRKIARARPLLVELIQKTQDPFIQATLVKNIPCLLEPEEGLFLLKPFLKSDDFRVVANTIEGLSSFRSPDLLTLIAPFLTHNDNRVRGNSLKIFLAFQDEKEFEKIRNILKELPIQSDPTLARSLLFAFLTSQNPLKFHYIQELFADPFIENYLTGFTDLKSAAPFLTFSGHFPETMVSKMTAYKYTLLENLETKANRETTLNGLLTAEKEKGKQEKIAFEAKFLKLQEKTQTLKNLLVSRENQLKILEDKLADEQGLVDLLQKKLQGFEKSPDPIQPESEVLSPSTPILSEEKSQLVTPPSEEVETINPPPAENPIKLEKSSGNSSEEKAKRIQRIKEELAKISPISKNPLILTPSEPNPPPQPAPVPLELKKNHQDIPPKESPPIEETQTLSMDQLWPEVPESEPEKVQETSLEQVLDLNTPNFSLLGDGSQNPPFNEVDQQPPMEFQEVQREKIEARECLNCGLVQSSDHPLCMICQGPLEKVSEDTFSPQEVQTHSLLAGNTTDNFSLTICPKCQFTVFGGNPSCENCGQRF